MDKRKSLASKFPNIAKEAYGWDPSEIFASSGKKLKWKCPSGHIYIATVSNRTKQNSGCPYCSGLKALEGFNDLNSTFPSIAQEADGWDPRTVTAGSGKKLAWKCLQGHQYLAVVFSRTSQGTGCPYCSGHKVLAGFNDLKTTNPLVAHEADGWDPKMYTKGSNEKKKWICKRGHKWTVQISHRSRGSGCPVCANQTIEPGFNDLATLNPKLSEEAYGWDPSLVAPQSNKKRKWKCSQGHVWEAKPSDRTRGNGCPVCSGQKVAPGINDLLTLFPEIAKEADGWDPSLVTPGSGISKHWICSKGHKWKAIVYSRKKGNGCPYCSNKKVLIGFNDLATTNPLLASEAFGWDPRTVTRSSGVSKIWVCGFGHKWNSPVARRSSGSGCPYCAGQKVQIGFNDLLTVLPKIAGEAYLWDPTSVTKSSDRIEKWKCPKGHIYKSAIKARSRGGGCSVCAGKKIVIGENDLATTNPLIALEAYEWDPKTVTAGSNKKKQQWLCPKGHVYKATPAERTRSDNKASGCGVCASKVVLVGFNDLATTHPQLASEAHGWDPRNITFGSGKKRTWKCKEGHIWKAIVSSRRVSGCPSCATLGYDPNEKGYLYLLEHPDWELLQIGKTNTPERRLKEHSRLGWRPIEIRGPMDGNLTQEWETAILRFLRKIGADLANQKIAGKYDGYSEAWSKSVFSATSIAQLMQLTEEFEEN